MALEFIRNPINIMHIGGVATIVAVGIKNCMNDETLYDKFITASFTTFGIGAVSFMYEYLRRSEDEEKIHLKREKARLEQEIKIYRSIQ